MGDPRPGHKLRLQGQIQKNLALFLRIMSVKNLGHHLKPLPSMFCNIICYFEKQIDRNQTRKRKTFQYLLSRETLLLRAFI